MSMATGNREFDSLLECRRMRAGLVSSRKPGLTRTVTRRRRCLQVAVLFLSVVPWALVRALQAILLFTPTHPVVLGLVVTLGVFYEVGDTAVDDYLDRSAVFAGCSLQRSSGHAELDRWLSRETAGLSTFFSLAPEFVFDHGRTSGNAWASGTSRGNDTDGTVSLGTDLVAWLMAAGDKQREAVAGVLAHEFAHLYQKKHGVGLGNPARELHADFLAGYYLASRANCGTLELQRFSNALLKFGDYDFRSPGHHGTPDQRIMAMWAGYEARGASLAEASKSGERLVKTL